MAHYTLIARVNAGEGKFPFRNVQFSKSHRPIPIENATYYIRPSSGKRTPIKTGKDVAVAHTALIRMEDGQAPDTLAAVRAGPPSVVPGAVLRKTVADAAREYIERRKQKSHKTLTWLSQRRQPVRPKLQEDLLRPDLPRQNARLSSRVADSPIETDRQADR
jgi:hypothetical protein